MLNVPINVFLKIILPGVRQLLCANYGGNRVLPRGGPQIHDHEAGEVDGFHGQDMDLPHQQPEVLVHEQDEFGEYMGQNAG